MPPYPLVKPANGVDFCTQIVVSKFTRFHLLSHRRVVCPLCPRVQVAFGSADNELTGAMVAQVVARKVEEHRRKVDMVQYAHASPTHRAESAASGKISAPGSPMRSPSNRPAH